MADPIAYGQSYNFSGFQTSNPTSPLPGTRVDTELAAVQSSTLSIVAAIKDIRRSDGALQNGIVGPDALSAALTLGFTLRGAWTSGESYNAGDGVAFGSAFYKARVQHVAAAPSEPDIDDDTWMFLFTFAAVVIADGSITPAKLDETQAEGFLEVLGIDDKGAFVGEAILDVPTKAVPVNGDQFGVVDSESGDDAFKSVSFSDLKAAIFSALGGLVAAATGKTTPVDADALLLADSAASGASKKLLWSSIKATLKTYFDTLYQVAGSYQPLAALLTSLSGLSIISGDLIYGSATATLAKLAKGSNGQFLTLSGGLPVWADAASTGQPIPSSSTFAVGTLAPLWNGTGGSVSDGSSVAGSSMHIVRFFSTGNDNAGGAQTGTWKNVSGFSVGTTNGGLFVRTA